MNVIISAPQGGGKTTTAQKLITTFFNAASWSRIRREVLEVVSLHGDPATLANTMHARKASAVLFDGCITNDKDLEKAQTAVKMYVSSCDKTELPNRFIAVYCQQSRR